MRRDFLEAYVEKLLRDVTGSTRISADADGDYPVRYGSALYFVRLVGDAQANVQVFAVAVDGVEPSTKLLTDINELNAQIRFARIFHVRGQVLVEADLVGSAVEPSSFYTACDAVASITDRVGPELAARHGGKTAFEDSKDPSYRSPETLIGMYL
jgi:Putative bacterial sensory transduction regulator